MRAAIVTAFVLGAATACTPSARPQPVLRPGIATVTAAYVERAPRRRAPLPLPAEEHLYASPPEAIAWWAPLDQWRARWPDSARVLDEWWGRYPVVAGRLEAWSDRNPEKLRALIVWAAAHPYDSIGALFLTRVGWGEVAALADSAPEAVDAFLHWARVSGPAAVELADHEGGLAYVESAARASTTPDLAAARVERRRAPSVRR